MTLVVMVITLMVIILTHILIMGMGASGKRQGIEQVAHLQQVYTVCFGCLQHVDEPLLQLDPVGHDEVRIVQQGHLGGRSPVVVRIGPHGEQHDQLGVGAHYVRNDVAQDRGGDHDQEARGRYDRACVTLAYRARFRTYRASRRRCFLTIRTAGREEQQASERPGQATVPEGGHGHSFLENENKYYNYRRTGCNTIDTRTNGRSAARRSLPHPMTALRAPRPALPVTRPGRTQPRRWLPSLSPGTPGRPSSTAR